MTKRRLFTAINLPDEIKGRLGRVISALPDLPAIKKVPPPNLHFTLNFLGYVEGEEIEEVKKVLAFNCPKIEQFKFNLTNLGTFPSWRRPRVLWLGIDEPSGILKDLQAKLHQDFLKLNFQFDRHASDFSPHLTLARIKGFLSPEILGRIKSLSAEHLTLDPVTVSSLELMESKLGKPATVYEIVESFKLGD